MKIRLIYIVSSFLLIFPGLCNGQDPVSSQPYNSPLFLNPSFAASTEHARAFLSYRNHWPSLGNTFTTINASYDRYFDFLHGGMGFVVSNDRQGDGTINRFDGALIYSYLLNVNNELSFNAGIQAGMLHYNLSNQNLVFEDMLLSGNMQTGEFINPGSRTLADFAVGLVGSWRNIYFGSAIHHLTRPDISMNDNNSFRLPAKYTFHAGSNIEIEDPWLGTTNIFLSPNVIYYRQGPDDLLMYGLYLVRAPLYIGTWLKQNTRFKWNHAVISGGIKFPGFSLGYSYDFSVKSELFFPNFGAHEVTFQVNFEYKEKRKKIRAIKCPKI